MQKYRSAEVAALLSSHDFASWYERYRTWWRQRCSYRFNQADPLYMGMVLVGDYEGRAAQAATEFAHADGSFADLSAFEAQRQKATATHVELTGLESELEDVRRRASEVSRHHAAARKRQGAGTAGDRAEVWHLEAESMRLRQQIDGLVGHIGVLRRKLVEENREREDLWQRVQHRWENAYRSRLRTTELAYLGRRLRASVEAPQPVPRPEPGGALGKEAGDPETRSVELSEEHFQQVLAELAQEVEGAFGCVLVEEFLYWEQEAGHERVWCVPLVDEEEHLNVQIKALNVYVIGLDRGVDFLEPLPLEREGTDAARLGAFFSPNAVPAGGMRD